MPQTGIHSVTIPGAVAAWSMLSERFGRLPLGEVLSPAIQIAEEGFPVAEITAAEWDGVRPLLRATEEAARVYLPGGRRAPRRGDVQKPRPGGELSRCWPPDGRDAFYRGDDRARIVSCSARHGGALTAADLAAYDAEWVTPLSTTYRGWTVYELPPNGQGIAALMMLNLIEHAPIGSLRAQLRRGAAHAHRGEEAGLCRHGATRLRSGVPRGAGRGAAVEGVRRAPRARDRSRRAPTRESRPGTLPTHGGDTTYLSVVDRAGNMVSLIQSNFASFGSGLVPDGPGFALQSRGGLFTLDPAHPNALAPRKRPLHTIIPGLHDRPGRHTIAFGIMGGWNQSQAHAQFVSNVVDHGMNIQAALEAARVTKLTFTGCDVIVESRVPAAGPPRRWRTRDTRSICTARSRAWSAAGRA